MSEVTIEQAMTLALQHHQAGRLSEAEAIYRQILTQQPNHAEAMHLLGAIAHQTGRNDIAISLIRQSIALKPDYAQAYNNLGLIMQDQGQLDEAIKAFREAVSLKPDYVEAYNNMGNTLMSLEQWDSAMASFQTTVQLNPGKTEAWNNLGNVLLIQGRLVEATKAYRKVIYLNPDVFWAHSNLGMVLKEQGQIDQAVAMFHTALQLKPDSNQVHDYLLFTLHFHPDYDARSIYEEHIRWNQQHAKKFSKLAQPHPNDPDPDRRLRIGYVSPDFRTHSVAFFMENLITAHDRKQVEIFCYADLPRPDDTSARFQNIAHHWRKISGQSDQRIADAICRDQIDILVDLAGHTSESRLLVFARKPAPIQITYLGYPNTTGLTTIDYRFTDAYADPPGMNDAFYTEKLVWLQNTFLCYRPPDTAPAVVLPPSLKNQGHVTFGCFNILPKINARVMEVWLQILRQIPSSRLLIKNLGLSDTGTRQVLFDKFAAAGIDRDRLDLRGKISSLAGHLELYHQVDIALDTFPYNGTTTTCEALWMGVPVITLAGQMHMSRVGVSLLSNVGLPELIAQTPQQYVEIAVKLAGDLPRLAELRRTLRQRMQASPLMDAKRFAHNVEAAYREMWKKWCNHRR